MDKLQSTIQLLEEMISDEHFTRPSRPGVKPATLAASCSLCRKVKGKCEGGGPDGLPPCERCSNAGQRCVFPLKAPPGRARGFSKRAKQLTEARDSLKQALGAIESSHTVPLAPRPPPPAPVASTSRLPLPLEIPFRGSPARSSSVLDRGNSAHELANSMSLLASTALQDGETVQQDQGDLGAWLAISQKYYGTALYEPRYDTDPLVDPVNLGIITMEDLSRLVDLYFTKLWPFLFLLDPGIHTPEFLRATSPFLTTVVAATSAMYCPQSAHLMAALTAHADWLSNRVFSSAYRSREIVYAYIFIVHWSPPRSTWDDDRSWQNIGQAIRIGQELRLDRPIDEEAFAEYRARTTIRANDYHALVEDCSRGWALLFCADLAISVQSGRMAAFSAMRLAGGLRGNLVQPAPDHRLYSFYANEILNRRFAKALVLLSGLEEELSSRDDDAGHYDLREAYMASWRADLDAWASSWPHINSFIAVHAQHVRLSLLATSLSLPGPERPILEECLSVATHLISIVSSWRDDAHDSPLYASNYSVTNIAFGASVVLKFFDLSDFSDQPQIRAKVLELCSSTVSTLLRIANARVNAPSMASIYAARLHSLLSARIASASLIAPLPVSASLIDPADHQGEESHAVLSLDDFLQSMESTATGNLLLSLQHQGEFDLQLDWDS